MPVFHHATDPRMYKKEEKKKADLYRQEPREPRDIELGLRAIAHDKNAHSSYRALARLLADDVFEIYTGEKLNDKHKDREKTDVAQAFVDSRFDQMRGFDEINAIMTKYGLSGKEGRAQAYRIRNGEVEPPKKKEVGKVKVVDASALSEEEFRRLALLGQATVERAKAKEAEEKEEEAKEVGDEKAEEKAREEKESHEERAKEKKAEAKAQKKKGKKGAKTSEKDEDLDALLASFSGVDAELQLEASKKEAEAKAQNELRLKKREREYAEATLREYEDLAETLRAYLKKAVDGKVLMVKRQFGMRVEAVFTVKEVEEELESVEKKVEETKARIAGLKGSGRQHKAFPYSRPDLTAEEKAKERSAHYRSIARGVRTGEVKARKGEEGEKEAPGKKSVTVNRGLVVLEDVPAPLKALVDARGVKEKAPTLPKKGSERKPYVGSVMKKKLLTALGLDESSKEGKKALREASRKYKEGGVSWEEVIASAR